MSPKLVGLANQPEVINELGWLILDINKFKERFPDIYAKHDDIWEMVKEFLNVYEKEIKDYYKERK
jgi:hypothetical protein